MSLMFNYRKEILLDNVTTGYCFVGPDTGGYPVHRVVKLNTNRDIHLPSLPYESVFAPEFEKDFRAAIGAG